MCLSAYGDHYSQKNAKIFLTVLPSQIFIVYLRNHVTDDEPKLLEGG